MDLGTIVRLADTGELGQLNPDRLKAILEILFTKLRAMEHYGSEYPEHFEFDFNELLRVTYHVKKLIN